MNKSFSFFFHYNKPLSKKYNKPIISVHYKKNCYFVENVVISVKTHGKINKKQPYFTVCGKAKSIDIIKGIAHIS